MSTGSLSPVARIALAIGAAGAAAFAWGSLVERTRWTLRRVDVPVLPAGARPIRVLHLSDLHMAPWQTSKQEWVRTLADLQPDLIVDTGDNLGHERGLDGIRRAFDRFEGVPGVFVNGSNDYFGPVVKNPFLYFGGPSGHVPRSKRLDIDALHAYFDELGWIDLDNAAAALEINGTRLEFFGVDDPHKGYDRLDLITGAIDELRANDPLGDESWLDEASVAGPRPTVTIGVAHAPYQRVLNSFVNHGAQLMLAGHTHGGQVCVPGFGALVTNCDIPRQQVKGLSVWRHGLRSAFLNVSAGLGTSIFAPVRFACPPEATLLTLVPAP
ncbi:metallophosphoesterase [Agromyces aerolatus]|uniref:metallophosphoesterase n=1 Tax=Agromyces sp. LY-1074 TaxID=3074080 RepID=UPI002865C6E8|nr:MULTISPECIES: metallophosphoesterase [unclassified Agromyces]MDR5701504.1 metallophosphoesterase [Agromyces sp. LY-1074]MDR5704429.1 metallophosphoesterase [Agromyces sp. LY-1358]